MATRLEINKAVPISNLQSPISNLMSETTKLLNNPVAIVTGAGQGLGEAIARVLAAAGARVVVNDLNPDRAERVAEAIRAQGGEAVGVAADVANKFQCVHLVEAARDAFGQLDILVNNAAVSRPGSIIKLDEWDWNRCLEVNLKGTFFMSQLVGRVMQDENGERGGIIINIASTAGYQEPVTDGAAYAASKAGIVGFTRACAVEFAAFGVRVFALLPEENPADQAELVREVETAVLNLCQPGDEETVVML